MLTRSLPGPRRDTAAPCCVHWVGLQAASSRQETLAYHGETRQRCTQADSRRDALKSLPASPVCENDQDAGPGQLLRDSVEDDVCDGHRCSARLRCLWGEGQTAGRQQVLRTSKDGLGDLGQFVMLGFRPVATVSDDWSPIQSEEPQPCPPAIRNRQIETSENAEPDQS